jgi:hypothetical protein
MTGLELAAAVVFGIGVGVGVVFVWLGWYLRRSFRGFW